MTPDEQMADELLAWMDVAEDQLRQDHESGIKSPHQIEQDRINHAYRISTVIVKQAETDRINAMACERATRGWCLEQLTHAMPGEDEDTA